MPERIVAYIAHPTNLVPLALHDLWAERGLRIKAYQHIPVAEMPLECLLFAPHWSNERYLSVEAVWKKYFSQQIPAMKLIIIGTAPGAAQNYFDLLFLPDDPHELFRNALPANAKWTPIRSGGVDVAEKLRRFIDGHSLSFDPDQSVRESFGKLHKSLVLNLDELSFGTPPAEIWEKIFTARPIKHFYNFLTRWESYRPYFETLPFADVFAKIENLSVQLKAHFENQPSVDQLTTWIEETLVSSNALYQQLLIVEAHVRD